MVRISASLMVAPVVLAMLFLLSTTSTTTATVVEKMATTSDQRPIIVFEEVVIVEQPKIDHNKGNRKTKMMFMEPNSGGLDAQIIKEVTASNTGVAIKTCAVLGEECSFLWRCCPGTSCVSATFWDRAVCTA